MTAAYKRHRSDKNQAEIVALLRQVGILVAVTSQVGNGFPDIVVGFQGKVYLIELKSPGELDNLTPAEESFRETWDDGYIYYAESFADVIKIIGAAA